MKTLGGHVTSSVYLAKISNSLFNCCVNLIINSTHGQFCQDYSLKVIQILKLITPRKNNVITPLTPFVGNCCFFFFLFFKILDIMIMRYFQFTTYFEKVMERSLDKKKIMIVIIIASSFTVVLS